MGQDEVIKALRFPSPSPIYIYNAILKIPICNHHLSKTFDEVVVLVNESDLCEIDAIGISKRLTNNRRLPFGDPNRCELKPHLPCTDLHTEYYTQTCTDNIRTVLDRIRKECDERDGELFTIFLCFYTLTFPFDCNKQQERQKKGKKGGFRKKRRRVKVLICDRFFLFFEKCVLRSNNFVN